MHVVEQSVSMQDIIAFAVAAPVGCCCAQLAMQD
jgi:hypothetical protein